MGHEFVAMVGSSLFPGAQPESCRHPPSEQILCLRCGGWSQGRGLKLGRQCEAPSRKGLEILSEFRKGHCPNPRARAALDRAVPLARLGLSAAPPVPDAPAVVRTSRASSQTAPS
eukprot:4189163-Pyramimonas_sp.AAC.1